MLSVILLAYDVDGGSLRQESVVRSLTSLVEGTVQGLIADAVLAGPSRMGLEAIADDAGCILVEHDLPAKGLAAALARARQTDVFVFMAGHAIDAGFVEEARDALAFEGLARARVVRRTPDSVLTRLAPALSQPVGLLARKDALVKAEGVELAALARKLRASDLNARARKCC